MPIVRIGPNTADTFAGLEDTFIAADQPGGHNGTGDLGVSKYDVGAHANTLLRFTGLSNLPSGITVAEARIVLSVLFNLTPAGYTVTVYRVLRNVNFNQAEWANYATASPWQAAGGLGALDRSATVLASYTFTGSETVGTMVTLTGAGLAQAVADRCNGVTSDLVLMIERTDAANDETYLAFASQEEGVADGLNPYLYVDYTVGGAAAIEGDLASTEGGDTASADGDVRVTGSYAGSELADSASIGGDVLVTGQASLSELGDSAAVSGDIIVTGSLAAAEAADAASAAGTTLSYIVILTSVETEADDRLTAVPDLEVGDWLQVGPVVTGGTIVDVTVNPDGTFSASEGVTSFEFRVWDPDTQDWGNYATQTIPGPGGEMAASEGADVAAIGGDVLVVGSWASSEAADLAAAGGSLLVTGAMAPSEAADSAGVLGTAHRMGLWASSEGADTASASAILVVGGSMASSEGSDAAAASGIVAVTGLADFSEAPDVAQISAGYMNFGTMASTEGADGFAADADLIVSAALASTEGADGFAAEGGTHRMGTMSATEEGQDGLAAQGGLLTGGIASLVEEGDTASAFAQLVVTGLLGASEDGDTALVTTRVQSRGIVVGLLGRQDVRRVLTGRQG